MPPEAPRDVQRKQFDRAVKSLRDLGPTIADAATYAEETYLASDRPDVELANAREYIVSTLASVAESLTLAASRLSANVQAEGEEAIAETELLVAAYSQRLRALNTLGILDTGEEEGPKHLQRGTDVPASNSKGAHIETQDEEGNLLVDEQHGDVPQDAPGEDTTESGRTESQELPAAKARGRRARRKTSMEAVSMSTASVQDCLDRMAGLPPKKIEPATKEAPFFQKDTATAREESPTPSSVHKGDGMFESPPWDCKPIDKVYTAESSFDGDRSSAFGTPSAELRGRPEVVRTAGPKVPAQQQGMPLKVPATRGGTGSSEDSLRLFRPPVGVSARGMVPRADTADTSQADWEEIEVGSQHTDEYFRGYDDEETGMFGGAKTPEHGSLVSDRRPGNSASMLYNGSGLPGSSTTPQRTRKRDIIKRAISKFKLHGHEHNAGLGEVQAEHV